MSERPPNPPERPDEPPTAMPPPPGDEADTGAPPGGRTVPAYATEVVTVDDDDS